MRVYFNTQTQVDDSAEAEKAIFTVDGKRLTVARYEGEEACGEAHLMRIFEDHGDPFASFEIAPVAEIVGGIFELYAEDGPWVCEHGEDLAAELGLMALCEEPAEES